jgi:hypothetical protein
MYGEPSAAVVRRRFPASDYGRVYVKRGEAGGKNIAKYGSTWAEATDVQRQRREEDGYRGRGSYDWQARWKRQNALASSIKGRGRYLYRRRPNFSFYF